MTEIDKLNLLVLCSEILSSSRLKYAILATSSASPVVAEEERRKRHFYLIGKSEFMCFLISDLVRNVFPANLLFYIS